MFKTATNIHSQTLPKTSKSTLEVNYSQNIDVNNDKFVCSTNTCEVLATKKLVPKWKLNSVILNNKLQECEIEEIPDYYASVKNRVKSNKANEQLFYLNNESFKDIIETKINRLWKRKTGLLCQAQFKSWDIFKEFAKSYSIIVFSPHNIYQGAKHAIDTDAFVFCASIIKSFEELSKKLNREMVITSNPQNIHNDHRLYLLCIPISDANQDYTKNEMSDFMFLGISGRRALIVGDCELTYYYKVERRGDYGFDAITVFDHHKWRKKLKSYIGKITPIVFNSHELLAEHLNADAYTTGALTADLIVKDVEWRNFARHLAIVGDKYSNYFPNLMRHRKSCEHLSRILNYLGIYILPEKDEKKKYAKTIETIVSVSKIIADNIDVKLIQHKIINYLSTNYGFEFKDWMEKIIEPEVNKSIHTFLSTDCKILIHRVVLDKDMLIPVQKETFYLLNQLSAYCDRTFIQYLYNGNQLQIMASRGVDNNIVDVSRIINNMPQNIVYGGKHINRMGFTVPALVVDKYKSVDYFLNIVVQNIKIQYKSPTTVKISSTPYLPSKMKHRASIGIALIIVIYVCSAYIFRNDYDALKLNNPYVFMIIRDIINGLTTGLGFFINELWDVFISRVKKNIDIERVMRATVVGLFIYSGLVLHLGYDYVIGNFFLESFYARIIFALVIMPVIICIPITMVATELFIDDSIILKFLFPIKATKSPRNALRFVTSIISKSILLYFNAFKEKVFWILNGINFIVFLFAWIAPLLLGGSVTLWVMVAGLIWAIITPIVLHSCSQHIDIFAKDEL